MSFIRAVELWTPDADRTLLECSGGVYGGATRLAASAQGLCFGRGEGLPGQAWEQARPLLLAELERPVFRRGKQARADGLSCALALPFFQQGVISAVLLIFCGDADASQAGAIELWHNDPAQSKDMSLSDGYYGNTADAFEFISRRTSFRQGTGLPGLAWASGLPVFMPDLGKGGRFLRADSALKVGINRGFAFVCAQPGPEVFVLAFLSALATPLVQRFESWLPGNDGSLRLAEGFCERAGLLGADDAPAHAALGLLGQARAEARPGLTGQAASDPGPIGEAARAWGLQSALALPVLAGDEVVAVLAWYL